jgi:polysaccharide export outer membrane protein
MPQEQPARVAPRYPTGEEFSMPPPPPVVDFSGRAPAGFVGPPGLSEEAKRSFTEIPPSADCPDDEMPPPEEAGTAGPTAAPLKARQRPEYVVEPPDLLLVEVLEALPGRPISGERLVRPDGRISLGFYGDIPIAGLTLPQIKERIVLHLRKFLDDETLGLLQTDEVGEPRRDPGGRLAVRDPKDTDRVFVDVTAYNSQNCYVMGDVRVPGRLPYTGGDTVLDLLYYAGGLLRSADKAHIRLVRSFPKGSPPQVLPINCEEIAMGTDSSTNYAILPNDRLVVPGAISTGSGPNAARGASNQETPARDPRATRASASQPAPGLYFHRSAGTSFENPNADLEKRIDELEQKLDRLIGIMEKARPGPVGYANDKPAAAERPVDSPQIGPKDAMGPAPARMMEGPVRRPGARPRPRLRRPEPDRPGPSAPRPTLDDGSSDSRPGLSEAGLEPPASLSPRTDGPPPEH